MKEEHPHAQVLRWIADGETVEARSRGHQGDLGDWEPFPDAFDQYVIAQLVRGYEGRLEFRIKPKTITVGDREIEAPIKSGPGFYITNYGDVFRWFEDANLNPPIDLQKLGRVYATEKAARAAQEAITALLTREPS
ncbi:hypothetical protein Daci_4123 [Delftia acidovorans SPH-1]|uniref:Uncharacterized protein n=1 Tax=Delftia acidovorans (strain DSM 14801 / SPH-1) TaxID=398578 RepID=A9BW29_DELAS|nr:hypothetical protein [Delftia acidovorans]ABX35845.1 hypothetical protein Daci_3207 [Delftia acidovorans SPH-1]ABX36754.1 hypothetical protein Daci_4123 [Delftia acidovorans SPH-1]QPS73984.1 hypothetical protein I6G48_25635 [Delftia acidovorans]QPS74880.1 hypothetical protein I6G48_30470 [Delftia acidovorans]